MRILCGFALFLLVVPCFGADAIFNQSTVLDDNNSYTINNTCKYFSDPSDTFRPLSANTEPGVPLSSNASGKLSIGFQEAPLWIKCQITNKSNNDIWILSINLPQITSMSVFSFVDDYLYEQQTTGMFTPYYKRPVKDFIPAVKLQLPNSSTSTHWIKVKAVVPLNFSIQLAGLEHYHSDFNVRLVVDCLFFGIILALLSYNLFLYLSIRDKSFLYYSIYLVCIGLYSMMLTGLSQKLLFSDYPQLELVFVVLVATGSLFFALKFGLKFLRLGVYRPKLKRINQFHFSALALCAVLGLFGSFQVYSIAMSFYAMLFIAYVIFLAVISWRKNDYQPAKRFLIAWTCLLVGIIIHGLEFNAIISRNFITTYIIQIATICEAVMLSFALGERFSLLKNEREKNHIKSTKQLNEANLKLKQALKLSKEANIAKAQLVSLISHELRTPINIFQGSIDSLNETASAEQKSDLTNASGAIKKLTHHVENLITSAEILNQALTPVFHLVDIKALVKSWVSYVEQNKADGVTFSYELSDFNQQRVTLDQRLVDKIVINLLDNACKFTKEGSIKLRIESQEKLVCITVEDTGTGISDAQMANIKQSFRQESAGFDRNYDGLGLGLTLAIHLANLIEGKLHITSEHKRNTMVTLSFPSKDYEKEVDKAAQESDSKRIGPFLHGRLLVVEDNKINAMVLSRLLKVTQCKLDFAEDGKQALDMMDKNQYDLVFMDLQMPIMDGITATKAIRDSEILYTPIIAVTANASQHDQERCAQCGMNGFVSKPIIKETLYAEINRWFLVPGNE
jgi:two-component system, sensor histidine kinase LadS